MERNICKFIGQESPTSKLKIINYVYETSVNAIYSDYVIRSAYHLYLVTDGSGKLNTIYNSYSIKKGDIFITYPSTSFKFEIDNDLKFIYISFLGLDATKLIERSLISKASPVISIGKDIDDIEKLWMNGISLSFNENVDLIANGILLYTLGIISKVQHNGNSEETLKERLAVNIKKLVDDNFSDTSLNLGKIAKKLNYNPNYLSFVFKETFKISFTSYLSEVRVNAAIKLIEKGFSSIKEIAFLCGFSDSLYFSKVFKKKVGSSPIQYISNKKTKNKETD